MSIFQTEYMFELPRGYVDADGVLHKKGVMRLATAADEIVPLKDPRVQMNPEYLSIILLSRVITSLGSLKVIDTRIIENLFTADMMFLQDIYQKINQVGEVTIDAFCPNCNKSIKTKWPF